MPRRLRPSCTAPGCTATTRGGARGFCAHHYGYLRYNNGGDWTTETSLRLLAERVDRTNLPKRGPLPKPRSERVTCWHCDKPALYRGVCSTVYSFLRHRGLRDAPREVQQEALNTRRTYTRLPPEERSAQEAAKAEARKKARVAKYEQRIADYLAYVDRTRGTTHGYGGYCHGCRCEVCTEATRLYGNYRTAMRALGRPMERRRKKAVHGTTSMYAKYGCRCAPCVEAVRIYLARKKAQAAALAADT